VTATTRFHPVGYALTIKIMLRIAKFFQRLALKYWTLQFYWPAVMVSLSGFVLSGFLIWNSINQQCKHIDDELQQRVDIYAQLLNKTLQHLVGDVQVLAQFYDASEQVTEAEFIRFTRPFLQQHPAVDTLEWVARVSHAERAHFEAIVQQQGLDNFIIRELIDDQLQPALTRSVYFPVVRIEPMTGNEAVLGFNMASEPVRYQALHQACTTGVAVASAPVTLVQDKIKQPAFLLFVPNYRMLTVGEDLPTAEAVCMAIRGFAVGVIKINDLMLNISKQLSDVSSFQPLNILLRDTAVSDPLQYLFLHEQQNAAHEALQAETGQSSWRVRRYETELSFASRHFVLRGVVLVSLWWSWLTALVTGSLVFILTIVISMLINSRYYAIKQLRANEERLRLAIDAAQIGLWDWDLSTGKLIWSPYHEQLWGFAPGEFDGRFETFLNRIHPDDRQYLVEDMERCKQQRTLHSYQFRVHWPDGSWHWIAEYGQFHYDHHDHARRMVGTVIEITHYKQAERTIGLFDEMVRASEDAIITKTLDGIVTSWNPAAANIFGYTAEEMIGQSIHILFPPQRRDEETEILTRVAHGARLSYFDSQRCRKDGAMLDVSVTVSPIFDHSGAIAGVASIIRDVTDRKQMEVLLKNERAQLQLFIDHAPAALAMFDQNMCYITCSNRWRIDYNLIDRPLRGLSHYDVFPDIPNNWRLAHQRGLAGEHVYSEGELFKRADGLMYWIRWHVCPWYDAFGQVAGIGIFTEDITRLKEDELRLRRYEHIVDASQDILLFIDQTLHIQIVNPAYAHLRHMAVAAMQGQHIADVVNDDAYRHLEPELLAALAGQCRTYHFDDLYPDGHHRYFDVTCIPFWNDDTIEGVVIHAHDITELQKARAELEAERYCLETRVASRTAELQASEAKLRTIYDLVPVAITITDPAGQIIDCNRASETLLRLTCQQCLKQDYSKLNWSLIHPDGTPMSEDEYASVRALREQCLIRDVEMGIVYPDQIKWLLVSAMPANHPDYGVVVAYVDMTEHRYNEQLREEKAAAERANRAKSAFIANMSHELRTPLNAILGFTQVLLASHDLPVVHAEKVAIIHRSAEFLLQLINDILDLAKIEAGRFDLFPAATHLHDLLHSIYELFAIRAQQRGITLSCNIAEQVPVWVHADERRLRQVLMGLLSNAIKFTEQGGVQYNSDYQEGYFQCVVEDTGIGIAPDRLPDLFRPFEQAADTHYKQQGTGLGLAISQAFVQQMGGHIDVESQLGQGSRFTIQIPLSRCAEPDNHTCLDEDLSYHDMIGYQRTDGKQTPLRIMVVDDIAENRQIMVQLLRAFDFQILEVSSGIEALVRVHNFAPDIIFMDLVMPGLDGFATTQQILAHADWAQTPIIAVSARAFAEDRDRSRAAGCRCHITKPVMANQLLAALAAYLPLVWIKKAHLVAKTPDTIQQTSELLAKLPMELRVALQKALILGWTEQIEAVLQEVAAVDNDLAIVLRDHVRRFEYEKLLNWLKV
jgi:PAS domain S-box-containing protein